MADDDFDFGFGGFLPEDAPKTPSPPRSPSPPSTQQKQQHSPEVLARIEQNRLKALAIREKKLKEQANGVGNAMSPKSTQQIEEERKRAWKEEMEKKRRERFGNYVEFNLSTMKDSKGGFLEEESLGPEPKKPRREERQIVEEAAIVYPLEENPKCRECGSLNIDPNYQKHYRVLVCKDCRGSNEKYAQISKTEAKVDYLLTESELMDSERLPFWDKPNPKRSHYARMYLYLRFQLEDFAIEKWGSLEALDAEAKRREEGTKQRQEAKFKKNLKELRDRTRTSVWRKETKDHEHEWGESFQEDAMTKKQCTICNTTMEYEEF